MQQVQNPPWSFFDEAQLIDISPPISPALAVWPGDEPPARLVQLDMERGDNLTLSSLHSTVHLGAHADAPLHYAKGGADIANCSLHYYFGPCQVISVDVKKGSRVMPEHVSVPLRAPRVLFRTLSYPDPHQFNDDFSALSSDLIDVLKKNHVLLVGIDTPSVDLAHDAALQTHQALARADMAVLEGLVLAHVPDGLYRLMAFPLPLVGFDASPVRAVLQTNVSV
jgi:arylformamidase